MSNSLELTINKVIPAPAKAVFEAWLDPKALAMFMKPMDGMPDCDVDVDATVGGSFLIVMKAGHKQLPHRGEYKTIRRYEELAFTWSSDHGVKNSRVTLTFKEIGPRETEMTLHHVGFADEESCADHTGGWTRIAEQLAHAVS